MAKIDAIRRASIEDYPEAPEWFERYLTTQNQVNENTIGALRGNLSTVDNTLSAFFTDTFAHGVEKIIRNPCKVSPVGVSAVLCEKLSTDISSSPIQRVQNVTMRYIQGKDPRAAEQLGITVYYEPPEPGTTGGVGETLESISPPGTSLLSSNTTSNITSINLTAGEWMVYGVITFRGPAGGVTGTATFGSVSSISAGAGALGDNRFQTPVVPTAGCNDISIATPSRKVVTATAIPYYLTGTMVFTVPGAGGVSAGGRITAVRTEPATPTASTTAKVTLEFKGG